MLIGAGPDVDEEQLERFDDMFEGTGIDYDLWSCRAVTKIEDEADILAVVYGELMDEGSMICDTGRVEDGNGRALIAWADGMPGKFRFVLPRGQVRFVVHAGSREIPQDVSECIGKT